MRILSMAALRRGVMFGVGIGVGGAVPALASECKDSYDSYAPGSECYPKLPYGEWVANWDGRAPPPDAADEVKQAVKKGTIRHLILIRHGQYDLDNSDHPLTKLGKEQASICGKRIKAWEKDKDVKIDKLVSSTMLRAKQTGDILSKELGIKVEERDVLISEGYPCPCDSLKFSPTEVFADSARIEAGFRKYCHRSVDGYALHEHFQKNNTLPETYEGQSPKETYTVLSCHGNVIRYFVMRSLQLPPVAWLRTATYNTGITHLIIYPSGRVSCYSFGDTGHLSLDKTTYH
eukprot:TRINITY_DN5093_c0_g1_i1.p1 TRINITY_DN5093_c0_g1~~TRINITY_DN5093_c0_g1_i1.p1  ORF type:complete len:290 (+),score=40.16 TRINITY_DN5093_c0_g1_i1:597-1466(+)